MKRWLLFESITANLVLLGVLLVLPYALENLKSTALMASQILIFAVVGLGFNILLGYTGLLSFGHGMFLGMGMYGATLIQIHFLKGQFVLPVLLGTALSALTGAVVGFLVMRRRGVYFALLTLAFTQLFFTICYRWTDVTGGENGISGLKRPEGDWQEVRAQVTAAFTPEACAGVRSFVWRNLPEIIERAEPMSLAIMDAAGLDTRYALLEGMLWAAHWRVWRDRWPQGEELREWLAKLYRTKAVEQPEDDAVVLLDRLLAEVVQLQDAPNQRHTVQHMALALSSGLEAQQEPDAPAMILRPEQAERYRRTLNLYGLHVPHRGEHAGCLAVASRHSWVARVMGTSMSYAKVLGRHAQCVGRNETMTPSGEPSRRCLIFSRGAMEGEPPI